MWSYLPSDASSTCTERLYYTCSQEDGRINISISVPSLLLANQLVRKQNRAQLVMFSTPTTKRSRGNGRDSQDSSQSSSTSPSLTQTTKVIRLATDNTNNNGPFPSLLCTLPPTCHPPHNTPSALANSQELELHYAKYHAHVCEERGCSAVFPDARLLELHQTECHDPLALIRKERGEKIFACHIETCPKLFSTPKTRRLHLIQTHGYPKEYFFAVTNKGVGGLLKKWGEGASLIRGSWKSRESRNSNDKMDIENGEENDSDDEEEGEEEADISNVSNELEKISTSRIEPRSGARNVNGGNSIDELADSLEALSLIPPSIRFGRGAKSGKVVRESRARNANGRSSHSRKESTDASEDGNISINIDAALEALKSDHSLAAKTSPVTANAKIALGNGRGRGGRGRGRARGRIFSTRGRG